MALGSVSERHSLAASSCAAALLLTFLTLSLSDGAVSEHQSGGSPSTAGRRDFVSTVRSVPLYNAAKPGLQIPIVGLGTGHCNPVEGGECMNNLTAYQATLDFLQAGGRRIDTAITYFDQTGIGKAIKASTIPREQIFITSKVGPGFPLGYQDTLSQMDTILKELATDYIDLLLIHWPGPAGKSSDPACQVAATANHTQCRLNTWRAMEEIFKDGTAYAIGVSNYEISHLQEILKSPGSLRPSVNQVEFHPYWQEIELLKFCQQHNITFNSYAPYAANDWAAYYHHWPHSLLNDTTLQRIATSHQKSAAQVVLRWHYQQGIIVNPRSQNIDHMRQNVNIFDFALTQTEMQEITNIPKPPVHPKVFPDPSKIP